ncbi:MAG TPA: hypothetical protein VJ946_14065 [Bacteroidales bacterium]|nr:hypothetical protein [Bacteroidales bacterium]
MKNTVYLLPFLLFFFTAAIAQEDIEDKFEAMEDKFDDAFEEEENDRMTLRFFDALSGEPLEGGKVIVRGKTLYSDYDGKVRFDKLGEDGNYPARFSMDGYISATYEFEVRAGTIFRNRFSVSPVLDIGSMRIVLDWDRRPRDLDAHFMKRDGYHISYRDTKVLEDGKGGLDRDDRNGFGPETITINDVDDYAVYAYYVRDYSNRKRDNSRGLAKSGATVRVYKEDQLVKTIRISEGERGNLWKVFTFSQGGIHPVNDVTSR